MTDYGITLDASAYLSNQGRFAGSAPYGVVVHTLECDAKPHIAEELSARGGYLDNENLAPQRMTDPASIVRTIPDGTKGGHVGSPGNGWFVGVEVSGRAGWDRSTWLDGGNNQAALSHSARAAAGLFIEYGHGLAEIEWLSGAQIKAHVFGLLGHVDVSTFVGGTNHWDPGLSDDFPYEWYRNECRRWFLVMTGGAAAPVVPVFAEGELTVAQIDDLNRKLDQVLAVLGDVPTAVWTKVLNGTDNAAELLNQSSYADDASRAIVDLPTNIWTKTITDEAANVLLARAANNP